MVRDPLDDPRADLLAALNDASARARAEGVVDQRHLGRAEALVEEVERYDPRTTSRSCPTVSRLGVPDTLRLAELHARLGGR